MTTAPAPPAHPTDRPRQRSLRRRWAFRGLTVALACGAMAALELSLRLVGFGESYELFVPVPGPPDQTIWRLNPDVDRLYFGRDMHGPEPRRFLLPKPPGVYRILFLGASTVNGFPYASEIAFPRQVEHLLEAQRPGVDVEVLNAGITAINSFEIADLAESCARCEPDLVVIHAGHNEFFGPGGPGSAVLPLPPALVRATFAMRRTRIGQFLGRLGPQPADDGKQPLESLPRLTGIRISDPEFQAAEENFRRNLSTAISALQRSGITVLVSTVASNLRDQGPLHNVWPPGLTPDQIADVERAVEQAQQELQADHPRAALAALDRVAESGRESALWQFRRGQALYARGEYEPAAAAFRRARDLDGCRFRAPGVFATIAAELVAAAGSPRVQLLDTAAVVATSSPHGIPGHELFLEHVHYNLSGHRLLARAFAQAIQSQILGTAWSAERDLSDTELDAQLGLLPEDELTGLSLAFETVRTRPLADAVDEERVAEFLKAEISRSYASLSPQRRAWFAELSLRELQTGLTAALARQAARSGSLPEAVAFAQAGVLRLPWSAESWLLLARALSAAGDDAAAGQACQRAVELAPDSEPAIALQRALQTERTE